MTMHDIQFPGETPAYRVQRDELLRAEDALRAQIEAVARLRRVLPLGGAVADYEFESAHGPARLSELFGEHSSLILYSFMYGPEDAQPCPMCSAFMDSVDGQIAHLQQRANFYAVARSAFPRLEQLARRSGWNHIPWLSAANNTYAADYHGETPTGGQRPMCTVFVRTEDGLFHFWSSELFFVPTEQHPRHVDMLWPLWHFFDLLPEGRGEFMPRLSY